jgi:thioredoxin 1
MRGSIRSFAVFLIVVVLPLRGFGQQTAPPATPAPLMTFVELGSVKCVPCRLMQPVLKNVEAKYGSQIKVVFYDVWKEEQKKYASAYGVRVIPTQVFLDRSGKEIFRHEGFFPESEIDALLLKHGLKPNS